MRPKTDMLGAFPPKNIQFVPYILCVRLHEVLEGESRALQNTRIC